MTFDEVRVVRGDIAPTHPAYIEAKTEQQQHTEHALESAADAAFNAHEAAEDALAWLQSVGADVPNRLKGIPTLLSQLRDFVKDETKRRR